MHIFTVRPVLVFICGQMLLMTVSLVIYRTGSGLTEVRGYKEVTSDFLCTQRSSANCTVYWLRPSQHINSNHLLFTGFECLLFGVARTKHGIICLYLGVRCRFSVFNKYIIIQFSLLSKVLMYSHTQFIQAKGPPETNSNHNICPNRDGERHSVYWSGLRINHDLSNWLR